MKSIEINYLFDYETIANKQEKWRLKQFHIFYGSGRPIFNINTDTEHLRNHCRPTYIKDVNKRIPISKKST